MRFVRSVHACACEDCLCAPRADRNNCLQDQSAEGQRDDGSRRSRRTIREDTGSGLGLGCCYRTCLAECAFVPRVAYNALYDHVGSMHCTHRRFQHTTQSQSGSGRVGCGCWLRMWRLVAQSPNTRGGPSGSVKGGITEPRRPVLALASAAFVIRLLPASGVSLGPGGVVD